MWWPITAWGPLQFLDVILAGLLAGWAVTVWRAPADQPRPDYELIAKLEHELLPEDAWTAEAHTDDVCGDCRWAVFSKPAKRLAQTQPSGVLEVQGPTLTANEIREIKRRFEADHARPALLINTPGLMQIVPRHAVDYDKYERRAGISFVKHHTVEVETSPEPDEPGPE